MQQDNGLEFKVGLFVVFALGVIAVMMVLFGRFGDGFAKSYTVTVTFPNADGLLKGADVNLAGAPVGNVSSSPRPLLEGGVAVDLKILAKVPIRQDSRFRITEVGMLGDRNIEIDPNPDPNAPELKNGDKVIGGRAPGLSGLTDEAQPILASLKRISDRIDSISTKVDEQMLTPETAADFRESMKRLKSVLTRTDEILAEAQSGKGTIGRLLHDPKTANNLTAFIANLREKGILFYSDVTPKEAKMDKDTADARNSR